MLSEINWMILSYTVIILSLIFAVVICFISYLKYKLKLNQNIKKEVRHKSYSKR